MGRFILNCFKMIPPIFNIGKIFFIKEEVLLYFRLLSHLSWVGFHVSNTVDTTSSSSFLILWKNPLEVKTILNHQMLGDASHFLWKNSGINNLKTVRVVGLLDFSFLLNLLNLIQNPSLNNFVNILLVFVVLIYKTSNFAPLPIWLYPHLKIY